MTQLKQTALVTGSTGRVGRLVRTSWRETHADIRPVFIARRGQYDIRWPTDLSRTLPPCDSVIAMWGKTGTDPQTLLENLTLARASRDLARACGARRVFHFSSSAVYGPGVNLSEDTPMAPVTAYGRSKKAMEELIASFDDDGIAHCRLRISNVVGAESLADALRGSGTPSLDQFADGTGPVRSYIGAGDLAQVLSALVDIAPEDLPPVLNIAAPEPIAMEALIRSAQRDFIWRPAPEVALREVSIDTSRLSSLLPDLTLSTDSDALVSGFLALDAAA